MFEDKKRSNFAVYLLSLATSKAIYSKYIAILGTFMVLTNFIESNLNEYAQKIVKGGEEFDDLGFGQLSFYLSLRRVLNCKPTPQDVGLVDAINDTLQELGIINKDKIFYK